MSKNFNVVRFLDQQVASRPDGIAIRFREGRGMREMDFSNLSSLSTSFLKSFEQSGVRIGDRVVLAPRPGIQLIGSVFALFQMGAVPVLLDPGMGLRKLLTCVRRTRPKAVVGVPAAILLSRIFRKAFASVDSRVTLFRQPPPPALASVPTVERSADDLAAILFTSGSTGPAKGVCYTHGMFDAQVRAVGSTFGIEPGEVDFPMLPVFALFNPALGMTTVLPRMNPSRPAKARASDLIEDIREGKVTNSFGSPVLWRKIALGCRSLGIRLNGLRRILIAGAASPPVLLRMLREVAPQATIHTPYGATECLPVSSITADQILGETWSRTEQGAGTCVGKAVSGVRIKVIEPQSKEIPRLSAATILPPGQVGEIIVTGPTVTREYDALPEATASAKIPQEDQVWHRMGDLGYLDSGDRLWFCGRKVEKVEDSQGREFYTDCCEAVFNPVPGVFRTALIAYRTAEGDVPALVVEPESGQWPRSASARGKLRQRLVEAGAAHDHTEPIRHFFLKRGFPVDVRHNAKIHRLTLAKLAARSKLKPL